MSDPIKFYKIKEPFGFCSNFYRARHFIYGRWWATTEHSYQAQKTNVPSEYDAIHQAQKPREARDLGQKVHMRENWDMIKDIVMYECVLAKFVQNHDIRELLLASPDDQMLIEDTASTNDCYWGCGADGTGRNELGKILVRVRKVLRG
jgi:ribA/ribD-fused uncharacterized protein